MKFILLAMSHQPCLGQALQGGTQLTERAGTEFQLAEGLQEPEPVFEQLQFVLGKAEKKHQGFIS